MKKGFTLVEIMIVVAIIAILAAIAIPNLLRARINANDTAAIATLKTLATAAESYAAANNGNYPAAMTDLTSNAKGPAYLNEDPTTSPTAGYKFTATLDSDGSGYVFNADPVVCNKTGTKKQSISTGAVFAKGGCS